MKCSGAEWSVEECSWVAPDDACLGHAYDTVVYCTASERAGAPQGAVRLIAADGSPSIDGQGRPEILMESAWVPICSSGISSGAAAVICKSMGFSGAAGSAKCSGDPSSLHLQPRLPFRTEASSFNLQFPTSALHRPPSLPDPSKLQPCSGQQIPPDMSRSPQTC